MTDTLSDPIFDVNSVRPSFDGSTMCVVFCPVSNCQSTRFDAGSYRAIFLSASAVK